MRKRRRGKHKGSAEALIARTEDLMTGTSAFQAEVRRTMKHLRATWRRSATFIPLPQLLSAEEFVRLPEDRRVALTAFMVPPMTLKRRIRQRQKELYMLAGVTALLKLQYLRCNRRGWLGPERNLMEARVQDAYVLCPQVMASLPPRER